MRLLGQGYGSDGSGQDGLKYLNQYLAKILPPKSPEIVVRLV